MRGAAVYTLVLVAALLGACNGTAPIYCTPDETMCHGSCSALYKDPDNCGACDVACGAGQVCSQGTCAASCMPGLEQCGSSCVETFIDRDNCGSCAHACAAGEVCSAGTCTSSCAIGQKICLASQPYCATIASDNANCGDCGVHCPPKEFCVAGACTASCALDQTLCVSTCVNLQSDQDHCGSCTYACGQSQHCIDGTCTCTQGLTMCSGACADTSSDKFNCGACGQACTNGTCTGGRCAIMLDSTTTAVTALAQDAAHLFWMESNGDIHRGSKLTSSNVLLATAATSASLAVDATNVYWPDDAAIGMIEINGTDASSQSVPSLANEVASDGTYVYVADGTGIRRFASGGGTVANVVADTAPHALATSNGIIFWANDAYELERANADGTAQSTLATMTGAIDHVATDGANVYFTSGSYVLSVPVQSSAFPLVLVGGLVGLGDIATDGTYVYWADATSISKVPVGGGATTTILPSSGDIARIVVDTNAVYWASSAGEIGKVTPK